MELQVFCCSAGERDGGAAWPVRVEPEPDVPLKSMDTELIPNIFLQKEHTLFSTCVYAYAYINLHVYI